MVRDVRARVYEGDMDTSSNNADSIPVKVDVETLYILEEKSDQKVLSSTVDVHISDYECNRPSTVQREDFAVQTTLPIPTTKPTYRPVGIQAEAIIEQHTVAAQTTDSLHRSTKERQCLPSSTSYEDETEKVTPKAVRTKYEIKRRHLSRHSSIDDNDNNDHNGVIICIDNKSKQHDYEDNFELKRKKYHSSSDDYLPVVPEQRSSFGQVTSRLHIDQLRDINRYVVRHHLQETDDNEEEHRSSEVYEIHMRGECKCIVMSYEEKTQYGSQTRFEKQLQRIEDTYTNDELKSTELHVIVTTSNNDYQLVKRDYSSTKSNYFEIENQNNDEKSKQPTVSIHYYTKDGHRMRTEHARRLENLPLVIRCEIEYELNHYGMFTADLFI